MYKLLIVAVLLTSTTLAFAEDRQQNIAKLKEDARSAVGIIGADKKKTRTYCEVVDLLGRELGRTDETYKRADQKDKKRTEALLQKINQLQKKIGPEYVVLENVLEEIDLKSPEGREIASIIQALNQSCPE
jgi:predicted transcriptional regulator